MVNPIQFLPSSVAHTLGPYGLQAVSRLTPRSFWRPLLTPEETQKLALPWRASLVFPNRFGIAGGVDKNALNTLDWQALGAGFLEVGTVTPLPQKSNPGKIVDRKWSEKALWNRLGFPNDGADRVARRLMRATSRLEIPLFINIGKNRETPNELAHIDYQNAALRLKDLSSVFVINVSSPNTKGLRSLQSLDALKLIFDSVRRVAPDHQLLLKLSPDFDLESLGDFLVQTLETLDPAGWILTNTTLSRPTSWAQKQGPEGGISGAPLANLSKEVLKIAARALPREKRKDRLLISVGGVTSPTEAIERLDLGADLVQTYSGLVFTGPSFFKECILSLTQKS